MSAETIPDTVVIANVRGTYELPQIYCGAAVHVGAVATPLLLEGRTTWSNLQFDRITDDQADRIGRAVNAAHARHGIPVRFDPEHSEADTERGQTNGMPTIFGRESLRTVTANGIYIMTVAATFFALQSSSELESLSPWEKATETSTFHDLSNPILHEFVTNPSYRGRALALQELWSEAKRSLRERTLLEHAHHYRLGVAKAYGTPGYRQYRAQMETRVEQTLRARLGSRAVRRAIAVRSGYSIPPGIVKTFAQNASNTLSTMGSIAST